MLIPATYQVTTPPASEPITLSEAKTHLKATDYTTDDAYITSLIAVARDEAEKKTHRALLTQTITMNLDSFPGWHPKFPYAAIRLFRAPLQELLTVKYYDSDNTQQTLYDSAGDTTKLYINTLREPPEIWPSKDNPWPSTYGRPDAIEIKYKAGWTGASLVPTTIKQAMLLIIGSMYERREDSVKNLPTAADALLELNIVRGW